MNWQPIEQAPKQEGCKVLLAGDDWVTIGHWEGSPTGGWWRDSDEAPDYSVSECSPTHFMALPDPPGEGPVDHTKERDG